MFSKHMPVQQCDDGVPPSTGGASLAHFLEYGWFNGRAEGVSPDFESQVLQNDKAPVGIPFLEVSLEILRHTCESTSEPEAALLERPHVKFHSDSAAVQAFFPHQPPDTEN